MKLPISSSSLLLCERLLERYITLCAEDFPKDFPPEIKEWMGRAYGEIHEARTKALMGLDQCLELITDDSLKGTYL